MSDFKTLIVNQQEKLNRQAKKFKEALNEFYPGVTFYDNTSIDHSDSIHIFAGINSLGTPIVTERDTDGQYKYRATVVKDGITFYEIWEQEDFDRNGRVI